MIIVAGKKYVKNYKDFVNTLFDSTGTASGFYTVVRNGIKLYNMQNELFAFICANNPRQPFFVAAGVEGGKDWYMHGTDDWTTRQLGIDGLTYSQKADIALHAMSQVRGPQA